MSTAFNASYQRPFPFWSGHLETIYPALFRQVRNLTAARRERLTTPDDDFLDLDWHQSGHTRLVIIQHGLEGSSDRPYVLGMARTFLLAGYDVLAWNFRSCSGEMNRTPRFYHSGATDDLAWIIRHAGKNYDDISLVGFSLGGNLTLKYLGEETTSPKVKRAVAISAPLDLAAGAKNLNTPKCYLYERRFLKYLKQKVRQKAKVMDQVKTTALSRVKSLRDFDEYYTAPLHGFASAEDYYTRCSSKFFLAAIRVPTLIVNAANDPLLTPESLNLELAHHLPHVHLEVPLHGGHVGFILRGHSGAYWSELRALAFCEEH